MSLKELRRNPIMLTDTYSLSHTELKCNTDWEVSHMYNRKAGMILYGLHETVHEALNVVVTAQMVREAEAHAKREGCPFPTEMWMRVVTELDGRIPLRFEALPEGTWCPTGTPFAQISNTVRGYGELVSWWEGVFMHAHFPSACATEAWHMRQYLNSLVAKYGEMILWKFHSFGFRGHRSLEDAYWAGTAWNLSLFGTDDFHTSIHTPTAAIGSIRALAHKVTQQYDSEYNCFTHAIDATHASGGQIVALVIDTYDASKVINDYVLSLALYAKHKNPDANGGRGIHLVFRPDSGDVLAQAVAIYEVAKANNLNNISVIIGEGISFGVAQEYDRYLEVYGVPLSFVFYGVGGGFYNYMERDTLGWAMKTSYSNGKDRMKVVKTNPLKQSIPGKIKVILTASLTMMVVQEDEALNEPNLLHPVYEWEPWMDAPNLSLLDWTHTQEVALAQTAKQEHIILSAETQKKIEWFKSTYTGA